MGRPPPSGLLTLSAHAPGNEEGHPSKGPLAPWLPLATAPIFTIPGMPAKASDQTVTLLQDRLIALIDLGLTLKHIHWNVVGPTSSPCT